MWERLKIEKVIIKKIRAEVKALNIRGEEELAYIRHHKEQL